LKRFVTFIDVAAICITILFLFFEALILIRSVAVAAWQLRREMYATHDWWIGALIIFSLIWCALRWGKAAYRVLTDPE